MVADATSRAALQSDYREFLALYGLKPHTVEAALRDFLSDAVRRGDQERERQLRVALAKRDLAEEQHPAQIWLDWMSTWAEAAINRSPRALRLPKGVFVGEFPHGSVNALTTPAPHGYLVLVDSGLLIAIRQILQGLALAGSLSDKDIRSPQIVDILAASVRAYHEYRDPMYGPLPVNKGLVGALADGLANECLRFIVGHEYAHVYLGHLDTAAVEPVATPAGEVSAYPKGWAEEFAADTEAYELMIENMPTFAKDAKIPSGGPEFARYVEHQSALAAPLVMFEIAEMLSGPSSRSARSSHPPCLDRQRNLAPRAAEFPHFTTAWVAALWSVRDAVIKRAAEMTYEEFIPLVRKFD